MKVEISSAKDGKIIKTLEDVSFEIGGKKYFVPAGFESDGMSIPRILWGVISPAIDGRTLLPSIIHDWIYFSHVVSRDAADRWYRDALIAAGFPKGKATIVYAGVRLFGKSHW